MVLADSTGKCNFGFYKFINRIFRIIIIVLTRLRQSIYKFDIQDYLINKLKKSIKGKDRAPDNIYIERLWRRVKYED